MTFAGFISTVVSSLPADVPEYAQKTVEEGRHFARKNALRRLMKISEDVWSPCFTRSSGKSATTGNKACHRETASMAAKMDWYAFFDGVVSSRSSSVSTNNIQKPLVPLQLLFNEVL